MPRYVLTEGELARGRELGAPMGGAAVRVKVPPDVCPRCGRSMAGRSWHQFLGHLGLHGLADSCFQGDVEACQRRLRRNGMARQDPTPWNGAWRPYVPVRDAGD